MQSQVTVLCCLHARDEGAERQSLTFVALLCCCGLGWLSLSCYCCWDLREYSYFEVISPRASHSICASQPAKERAIHHTVRLVLHHRQTYINECYIFNWKNDMKFWSHHLFFAWTNPNTDSQICGWWNTNETVACLTILTARHACWDNRLW